MNEPIMREILDTIRAYERIILMRHARPDGDAVGSTLGFKRILSLSFPEKEIYVVNEDYADYMAFLGTEDAPLDDALYAGALGVVLDTGTVDRISNTKYSLCDKLIKIDHHIDDKPYGDLSWVEDFRSSVCEMIAAFYDAFADELRIDAEAATCLYAGMVTDSGRFRYDGTSGDTLRLAARMLDQGIDTETLFAHLYLSDYSHLKYQAAMLKRMKMTEHGVAYLDISRATQRRLHLTTEEASTAIGFLDGIKGSLIWLALIEYPDKTIRVRLRSRFVTVQELATRYHGGGHACASGATVYSKKERKALLRDADALLRDYKEQNEGWL